MLRTATAALMLLLFLAQAGMAQEWARKMFEGKTEHDFGTVARGAKAVYSFKFKNPYKETVHVAGVRSSCGCGTASIVTATVPTYETGEILVEYNTRSFLGYKSATITVTFDQPFPAEVQLQVSGNIRGDVVFHPGVVQLGTVDQGTETEQKISVNYAGRSDWQIVDVMSTNPHFEVELNRTGETAGRISYELLVRLKGDAPAGYLNDQLLIVTNDSRNQQIPLAVEARITPQLTVSPASLYLGNLAQGQTVTKQVVVRGKRPFKILEVSSDSGKFAFNIEQKSETLYLVGVTFDASEPGTLKENIAIRTDQEGVDATLVAHATVTAAATTSQVESR